MNSKPHEQILRLVDFESRKKADPAGLVQVPDRGWEYITIHPMSNETALIKRLGLRQSDCTKVDCYWCVNSDVVFLQVLSQKDSTPHPPGLYARWSDGQPPILNLVAVVKHAAISQRIVEEVMSEFSEIGFDNPCLSMRQLKAQLTPVRKCLSWGAVETVD